MSRQATTLVRTFLLGKDMDSYVGDALLRSAVERQLEIAGEALSQLARIEPEAASLITDVRSIVAFRNILAHGYADVDHRLVWTITQTKLETLAQEVAKLLNEA